MVVADTHAWLWWLSGDASLSAIAGATLARAFDEGDLGVSAMSVWEAAMLVKTGRLALALPLNYRW